MPNDERRYFVFCEDNCKFEAMTKEQIINAIAQATGVVPESIDVDAAFVTKIKDMNTGRNLKFWIGTTAQYQALQQKEPDTLYILTDDEAAETLEQMATAVSAILAGTQTVGHAVLADFATNATNADFATNAGRATEANRAQHDANSNEIATSYMCLKDLSNSSTPIMQPQPLNAQLQIPIKNVTRTDNTIMVKGTVTWDNGQHTPSYTDIVVFCETFGGGQRRMFVMDKYLAYDTVDFRVYADLGTIKIDAYTYNNGSHDRCASVYTFTLVEVAEIINSTTRQRNQQGSGGGTNA